MSQKILITEDEKPIAKALKLKLEKEGYLVTVAENGRAALDFLKKDQFDLLILDLLMPELDGFAILNEIKNMKLNVHIIVASNLGQEEDLKRATKLGAETYFVKSNTSLAQIVEQVKKVLL